MEERKVFVKIRKFNNNFPDEVFFGTRRSIGATISKNGLVNTGLTRAEEKKYLPRVLGIAYDSTDWNKKLKEYFSSLTVKVKFGEQVELNLSTDEDGNPVDEIDFIKYKFILVHPELAMSKEECIGQKIFYLYDPKKSLAKEYSKLSTKKTAYKELIKLSDSKVKMVMHVLGLDTRDLSKEERELILEKEIERRPERFIEVVQDKDLENKAFIEECISAQVLSKVGTSIIDGDVSIGGTMKEALIYLKDKNNSGVLVKLKARLDSFNKT